MVIIVLITTIRHIRTIIQGTTIRTLLIEIITIVTVKEIVTALTVEKDMIPDIVAM